MKTCPRGGFLLATPCSLLPAPCSLKPRYFYLTSRIAILKYLTNQTW
ncbi:hypothetical protein [Moorena producens]|nr:hypothetical protein [Moorena producens]